MQPNPVPEIPCPCCGLPTLSELVAFEICRLCHWQDDGQDDDTADEIWGGPNGDLSLTRARENFRSHFHVYDACEKHDDLTQPSPTRKKLIAYVSKVMSGEVPLDRIQLGALLREL